MSLHETQQVEEEPLEELWNLDVHDVTIVAATTTANTASCGNSCGCTHVTLCALAGSGSPERSARRSSAGACK